MTLKLSPQFFFSNLNSIFPYLQVQVTNGDSRCWNWSSIEREIFWLKTQLSSAASLMSALLLTPLLIFFPSNIMNLDQTRVGEECCNKRRAYFCFCWVLFKCVSQWQKYLFCKWSQWLWWEQWQMTVVKQRASLKETYYAYFQTHNFILGVSRIGLNALM